MDATLTKTRIREGVWQGVLTGGAAALEVTLLGEKIPGVSTNTICVAPASAMPRTRARVVWTLRDTIDTLAPTSALRSVDLPALGAPISAT